MSEKKLKIFPRWGSEEKTKICSQQKPGDLLEPMGEFFDEHDAKVVCHRYNHYGPLYNAFTKCLKRFDEKIGKGLRGETPEETKEFWEQLDKIRDLDKDLEIPF